MLDTNLFTSFNYNRNINVNFPLRDLYRKIEKKKETEGIEKSALLLCCHRSYNIWQVFLYYYFYSEIWNFYQKVKINTFEFKNTNIYSMNKLKRK